MSSNFDQWFYAQGGSQYGPVAWSELRQFADSGQLQSSDLVWSQGMGNWAPAHAIEGLIVPQRNSRSFSQTAKQAHDYARKLFEPGANEPSDVNRVAVGVLAILLGCLGIHKFILGRTGQGAIMLLATCTFLLAPAMAMVGLVEGIIYLTRTDEDFHRIYVRGRRGWF
jgi:TM2 domain-containing membrane protein YozV